MIKKQLNNTIKETNFSGLGKFYNGKVRDNYIKNGKRIMITTDRISAFDRVLGTIPFKGQVLNQITKFWFSKTKGIANNHMIDSPDPNVIVGKECKPIPVEMVIRGYITGVTTTSAWYNYERGVRNFCGNLLPDGLKKDHKFDKPIITPSTKAEKGGHDRSLSKKELIAEGIISEELFDRMAEISLKVFDKGSKILDKQGLILVDTKYEFGMCNGELMIIDEIHTSDSSRFWYKDTYKELFEQGKTQKKLDKEYVREWLAAQGFIGNGKQPQLTNEVRIEAAKRYITAFEIITGNKFEVTEGNAIERIRDNLIKGGYM